MTARAHVHLKYTQTQDAIALNTMLAVQLTEAEAQYTGIVAAGRDVPPFVHYAFLKGVPGESVSGVLPNGFHFTVELGPEGWGAAVYTSDSRWPDFEF